MIGPSIPFNLRVLRSLWSGIFTSFTLKVPGCMEEVMCKLPIKGWPSDVIEILESVILDIVQTPKVVEFYIGRTDNIPATKSRHNCEEIYPLYETDSADHAIEVEDALIKGFFSHSKCCNDVDHGGGGASDYYLNYVYIALWFK